MKKGDRPGLDWEQFEKYMGTQLPFMPKNFMKGRMEAGGDWIGEYVQDVLKRSFGERAAGEGAEEKAHTAEAAGSQGELDYEYETFETHSNVIVRVSVPPDVHVKNIHVYAGSTQLKLEQDPSRKKLYIDLPRPVEGAAAKAVYKDRILEIRLPKLDEADIFQEVRVRYL